MDLGIKGKTALVTASSKGMGKACALGLAAEGARVVMCARTERDLLAAADDVRARTGGEVVACRRRTRRTGEALARAPATRSAVRHLVANAGGPPGVISRVGTAWYGALEVAALRGPRIREVCRRCASGAGGASSRSSELGQGSDLRADLQCDPSGTAGQRPSRTTSAATTSWSTRVPRADLTDAYRRSRQAGL